AVAVTRRERMESWLAALTAAGLAPTQLAPVTLSLPLADRAWTLAFVDGEMVLRSGARAGLGGPAEPRPPAWLHAALAEARTESSAPGRILLVDAPADLDSAAWREALGLPLESMPGDATVPAAPLDLLQQHYAPRARLAALKRAYIPAAALLAAWLFATLALDAIEWARVSRAAGAAEEEMRALLLKSFPETRAILDPAEQMRRGLEDLGAGSGIAAPGDMLFLLARAARAIGGWPPRSPYPSARRFSICSSGARSKAVSPRRARASPRFRRSSPGCRSRPPGWRACGPRRASRCPPILPRRSGRQPSGRA